ncbi:MAG: plastocyanin/azurin family copper-binding protein [Gemmatimonadaceae bacterium]
MRFKVLALVVSAFVLGACAGGDRIDSDTTAAMDSDSSAMPAMSDTTGSGAMGAGAPVSGTTHEVQMVLEGSTYKYVPADITVKAGDQIKFINASGGPHNVAFKAADMPAAIATQLDANMPATVGAMQKMGKLAGPLVTEPNGSYTISFAGIAAGTYPYVCTPHEALGMKGTITVQEFSKVPARVEGAPVPCTGALLYLGTCSSGSEALYLSPVPCSGTLAAAKP